MKKEINCNNFIGLFAFLRKQYGDDSIRQVIDGLIDNEKYLISDKIDPSRITPVQEYHLNDSAYWVSNEFSLALLANVKKVVGGNNPLFVAGEGAVVEQLSKSILFISRIFGPKMLSKQVAKINARFNRTKEVKLVDLSNSSATFMLRYFPNVRVTRDVCNWNRGIYSSSAKLAGAIDVKSEEIKCVLDGDECCTFKLTWKQPSSVKQFIRWFMKSGTQDLIADYELTIRERDQLIDRLTQSEKRYRDLVENINDIIYAVDNNGIVTYISPAVKPLMGYDPSEIIGEYFLDYIYKEDVPGAMNRFQEIIHGKNLDPGAYRILDKYGSARWASFTSKPNLSNGKIVGAQGVITDITALKQAENEKKDLEERLARSQKMEALGLLAGGVAHDLNNVLSGLVSYPDLLLMDLPESSSLRKPILTIQDSGRKAAAIVQDLLTLARRGVTDTEVVNFNNIVFEYLKSPEHEALKNHHRNVDFETSLDENLLNIRGSSIHLKKTLMNLISNAAEALPHGGQIIVATENRHIDRPVNGYDTVNEGDFVVLKIEDNGTGIPEDDLKRIFEPFYTKKVMGRSGTGLGMAVVWGTIQDHRGYIDIQSAEGKGTTFELYFPVVRETVSKEIVLIPVEDYLGNGERILVVDDVKAQREIASGMLSRLGYSANAVSSGEEAIEYLKSNTVDLLVLDMIMEPGIDGLETYKRAIKLHSGQKAIIASGFSETDDVREVQRLGAGSYLKKPYMLEKIGIAVKNELEK